MRANLKFLHVRVYLKCIELTLVCLADSRIYIWRRQTGMQVAALEAHTSGTVNAVSWHPTNPSIFASAGDDRRVRM